MISKIILIGLIGFLAACEGGDVSAVKNGTLHGYPSLTIGQAFDNRKSCDSTSWEEEKGSRDENFVVYRCDLTSAFGLVYEDELDRLKLDFDSNFESRLNGLESSVKRNHRIIEDREKSISRNLEETESWDGLPLHIKSTEQRLSREILARDQLRNIDPDRITEFTEDDIPNSSSLNIVFERFKSTTLKYEREPSQYMKDVLEDARLSFVKKLGPAIERQEESVSQAMEAKDRKEREYKKMVRDRIESARKDIVLRQKLISDDELKIKEMVENKQADWEGIKDKFEQKYSANGVFEIIKFNLVTQDEFSINEAYTEVEFLHGSREKYSENLGLVLKQIYRDVERPARLFDIFR